MIIRIVKMTFHPEKVNEFLSVFDQSKEMIRNMEGCRHLELLSDIKHPHIFFTYSFWESESDLNNYRDSSVFKNVWTKTKVLFSEKAEAWSVESKIRI